MRQGSLIFTIFGAIYYWFPKAAERLLSERLGRWHFWLFVVGFNLTFLPLHWAGMLGVPLQAAAVFVFLLNIVVSLRRGERGCWNCWDACTPEWATGSQPPPPTSRPCAS